MNTHQKPIYELYDDVRDGDSFSVLEKRINDHIQKFGISFPGFGELVQQLNHDFPPEEPDATKRFKKQWEEAKADPNDLFLWADIILTCLGQRRQPTTRAHGPRYAKRRWQMKPKQPISFSTRIRVARARLDISMSELGKRIGVAKNTVFKYENDECLPSSSTLVALGKALDVSLEWLTDQRPLDFHSTADAPQGEHAKYWVKQAIRELASEGFLQNVEVAQ